LGLVREIVDNVWGPEQVPDIFFQMSDAMGRVKSPMPGEWERYESREAVELPTRRSHAVGTQQDTRPYGEVRQHHRSLTTDACD